jgi:hypothetical protein
MDTSQQNSFKQYTLIQTKNNEKEGTEDGGQRLEASSRHRRQPS